MYSQLVQDGSLCAGGIAEICSNSSLPQGPASSTCLTPPESLIATTSSSEFSLPFQQRRKLRPIRPKPLMATFSFFSHVVTCLLPPVACAQVEQEVKCFAASIQLWIEVTEVG